MKKTICFLLLVSCGAILGCGQANVLPKPTVPGRGKILLTNGQPARYCSLMLTPVERKSGGFPCWATTGPDGSFLLKTGNEEGVVPGVYRVALRPFLNQDVPEELIEEISNSVPVRFQDDDGSPLLVTVHCETDLQILVR